MENNLIEPTNKTHRILFTTLIILLTAGVIGGSVYYVLNKQNKDQQKQIEDLQKQVLDAAKTKQTSDLKAKETVSSAPSITVTKKNIRDVDFSKIIQPKYKESTDLLKPVSYGDFNNDGEEEALISYAHYAGDGTAPTEYFVYGYSKGDLKRTLYIMGGIHSKLEYKGNELVYSVPIYNQGDAMQIPSGGMKYDTYKWNGSEYLLDKETKTNEQWGQ